MPARARSVSVAEPNGANGARRSTRVVPPSPAKSTTSTTAKPTKAKRARSVSVAPVAEDSEPESDNDDSASTTGQKRKRGATPTPKTAKVVPPKKIKIRVPIQGINPIPTLYPAPFEAFDFEIPTLPKPTEGPRRAFVFGNGDFGQHGLGVDEKVLCEIKRPRPQAWFEGKIEEKAEGWEGGIAGLECGGMHTLALDGLGRVWSWGINDNAALGRNTAEIPETETSPKVESEELETSPMLVEGLQEEGFKAVRIAAGDSVSLAISDLGEVRCWGSFRASEGILGFDGKAGSSQTQLKPVALPNLDAHTIVQIATGDDHFIALTSKGQVFACGNGEQNQLGRKIIQRLSIYLYHLYLLLPSFLSFFPSFLMRVLNRYNYYSTPGHKTHGLTPERLSLRNIVTVGSGSYHSFAVNQSGQVYAWGLNSFHQTGVDVEDGGWADTISSPTLVAALDPSQHGGARVVEITGGVHHSVFLFSNGEVWACGRCDGHEVGLGSNHPAMLESEERKQEALKERREREVEELEAINTTGGMGDEEAAFKAAEAAAQGVPLPNPHIPIPQRLSFPTVEGTETGTETKIIKIASGTRHNFAVASDGAVYAWGMGNVCQLGLGDEEEAEVPTRVRSVKMEGFRGIAASTGGQHSVIVAVKP
ncbi:regulator of chromosome condensation, partial [Phenoliferia sp. Uapishka_3]